MKEIFCKNCQKTLIPNRKNQIYCSRKCFKRGNYRRLHPIIDKKCMGGCGQQVIHPRKRCKKCLKKWRFDIQREWHMKKKYGITLEDFEILWKKCNGRCVICTDPLKRTTPRMGQDRETVVVDHDHKTGRVRGIICGYCNRVLGIFKDDIETFKRAIFYLSS